MSEVDYPWMRRFVQNQMEKGIVAHFPRLSLELQESILSDPRSDLAKQIRQSCDRYPLHVRRGIERILGLPAK